MLSNSVCPDDQWICKLCWYQKCWTQRQYCTYQSASQRKTNLANETRYATQHTQSDTISVASIHSKLLNTQQFVHVLHKRKLAKAQTQRQGFGPRHFREPHNVVDRLVPYSSKNLQIFDV